MSDTLQRYTNYGGETVSMPAQMKYFLPKGIEVIIWGIDITDCLATLEKRREEFSKGKHNIEMYTPRLSKYYQDRKKSA
jgi:hypothetical protein